MKKFKLFSILVVISLCISSYSFVGAVSSPNNLSKNIPDISKVSEGFFTENKGQWDPELLFIGNTNFGRVAIGKDCIYYNLIQRDTKTSPKQPDKFSSLNEINPIERFDNFLEDKDNNEKIKGCVVKLNFQNLNKIKPIGIDPPSI